MKKFTKIIGIALLGSTLFFSSPLVAQTTDNTTTTRTTEVDDDDDDNDSSKIGLAGLLGLLGLLGLRKKDDVIRHDHHTGTHGTGTTNRTV
jgi:MYXO-CTERM domain-containing protein